MTRALVTGATGFVGRHLIEQLQAHGRELFGTVHGGESTDGINCPVDPCDVSDPKQVFELFDRVKPHEVYHLAAITFVPEAALSPQKVIAINLGGTLNLLEAVVKAGPDCTLLAVCSGEVYGAVPSEQQPINEQARLEPRNIYAVSKLSADLMAQQYAEHKAARVVRARPFNHTGPGQSSQFVCSDFARQIAQMEAGTRPPQLHVGNTDAVRDFSDVRDVVTAYRLLVEQGTVGEAYNVCSGHGHSIEEVINLLIAQSRVAVEVVHDPDRMRPSEVPSFVGDYTKIHDAVGWEPTIDFQQTLSDTLDYWRTAETGAT